MYKMEEDLNFDANPNQPSKDRQKNRGKRGCLSRSEISYIKKNASLKSADEIAVVIGKTPETIKRFIHKKNLVSQETLEIIPDAHRRVKIKKLLYARDYWKEIKKQFSKDELETFEEYFVSLYLQFDEDVLAAEELQIKKYITLEILKDRMLRQDQQNTVQIEQIKEMLDIEYSLPSETRNPEAIKTLTVTIEKLQTNQLAFLKEFREMTSEQKDVEKKLKVSRDDRVKISQDASQNFSTVIRVLHENPVVRDNIGRRAELHRIAANAQRDRLFSYHTYFNGDVDYPILSHESIKVEDEKSNS